MTPLQLAQEEWEQNTTPHAKLHRVGKQTVHEHEFRKYGQAIAWLKWDGDCIEIAKFETLQPSQGNASKLIEFLKNLSNKYKVRIFGHATAYLPDPPIPKGELISQKELEEFYSRHGFKLRKITRDASEVIYPLT
jgi:hypothetical protein